jgi:hypothetical protein
MHELWHWYFWHNGGKEINIKYGFEIFNAIKESLTVLLNIEFADIIGQYPDRGYPHHYKLREGILKFYQDKKDIYSTIDYCLKFLNAD